MDRVYDAVCDVTVAARVMEAESRRRLGAVGSLPATAGALEEAMRALARATEALATAPARTRDAETHRALASLALALGAAADLGGEARAVAAGRVRV